MAKVHSRKNHLREVSLLQPIEVQELIETELMVVLAVNLLKGSHDFSKRWIVQMELSHLWRHAQFLVLSIHDVYIVHVNRKW